ncbi:uncharacterized protein LOC129589614 isoform X2 [Paramacrobiotus metropolitanus]|uniref:uncharacterized protein LOC129589614 isoform X2 n=1 Tax=Paramacrobiotus metropolitanus TaxID=2943436 RepID=UPI0024457116|nr:uncharacterized protein LOC129589614 isoform X2 [Paramacrobiotus metropolitanus]
MAPPTTLLSVFVLLSAVVVARGLPNLTTPAITIPYNEFHIQIFNASKTSSNPVFYYLPTGILLPNTVQIIANNATDIHSVTVLIQLWNYHFLQKICSFLIERTGDQNVTILPVPFKWLYVQYSTEHGLWKEMTTEWQPIAHHPQSVPLRIRCATMLECEHIRELIVHGRTIAELSVHLHFAYERPKTRKTTLSVDNDHLVGSPAFNTLTEHFAGQTYVYLQRPDYYSLIYEVLMDCIGAVLEADEFIDDQQIISFMMKMLPIFRRNITSTGEFTDAMWAATYWPDGGQRPDQMALHLHNLFSNRTWLRQAMMDGNITFKTDGFLQSEAVTSALRELKPNKNIVRWDGEKVIIAPTKMYCLDLEKLRDQQHFRTFPIRTSKASAQHVTSLILPDISAKINLPETDGTAYFFLKQIEAISNVWINITEAASKRIEELCNNTHKEMLQWKTKSDNTSNALTESTMNLTQNIDQVKHNTGNIPARIEALYNNTAEELSQLASKVESIATIAAEIKEKVISNIDHTLASNAGIMAQIQDSHRMASHEVAKLANQSETMKNWLMNFSKIYANETIKNGKLFALASDTSRNVISAVGEIVFFGRKIVLLEGNVSKTIQQTTARLESKVAGIGYGNECRILTEQFKTWQTSAKSVTLPPILNLKCPACETSAIIGKLDTLQQSVDNSSQLSCPTQVTQPLPSSIKFQICEKGSEHRFHWQARKVEDASSIGNTVLTATLHSNSCAIFRRVFVLTNSFGEFSLALRGNCSYTIVFNLLEYRTITFPVFDYDISSSADTFMEPLIFIRTKFSGKYYAIEKVILDSSAPDKNLAGTSIKLRSGLRNYNGSVVAEDQTDESGLWGAFLETGYYTATL